MSARLKAQWLARTPRERWLLGVMFALLALVLVWFLILRPLGDMLSAARERHGLAVAGLEEQGYVVERLSASSNPDRTLSAQIVLRARGG